MENEAQIQKLLRSIAISGGSAMLSYQVSQKDRLEAFHYLESFKKYDSVNGLHAAQKVVSVCMDLIGRSTHTYLDEGLDVTTPTKVFALGCISDFVRTRYYAEALNDGDRAALRNAVRNCGRQLVMIGDKPLDDSSSLGGSVDSEQMQRQASRRIIGSKISAVLTNMAVRDFPQRWTTFADDILSSTQKGGLWDTTGGEGIGAKMCLECLSSIVQDCTDSDFNSDISTVRRNDVLTGLNELSDYILSPVFELLRDEYSILLQTRQTIQNMISYLQSQGRTPAQMSHEEGVLLKAEESKQKTAGALIVRALQTTEMFCRWMPLDWMTTTDPNRDLIAVFNHLLREPRCQIQLASLDCLSALSIRKLEFQPWFRLVQTLPAAVQEANAATSLDWESDPTSFLESHNNDPQDKLVKQLPFYLGISRVLSLLLYTHVAHITTDTKFLQAQGDNYQTLASFFKLMTELLQHPSPKVAGEQVNTWCILLRDPQIATSHILSPFLEAVLQASLDTTIRIRWSDVEEGTHPLSALMEESWDDKESYEMWMNELRSKSTRLFRLIGKHEPVIAVSIIGRQIISFIDKHGREQSIKDLIDPKTGGLTEHSQANLDFDAVQIVFENALQGVPDWTMNDGLTLPESSGSQGEIVKSTVKARLSELASALVTWAPKDVWLQFRHTTLLQVLRLYWIHDPTSLANGVDLLLKYISAFDERDNNQNLPGSSLVDSRLSDEVKNVRKKAGMALITISKKIPHLLLPWLGQLSERVRTLLSSDKLLNSSRMHLYEFLSCVASAIEQPVDRAKFISDVLFDAVSVLESEGTATAVSSVDAFMNFLGITSAGMNPSTATDPVNVDNVTRAFARLFSAFNQILSVGKRCLEARKNRPNGGIPMLEASSGPQQNGNMASSGDTGWTTFPDEGPVTIDILARDNPFVLLWPKILAPMLRTTDVLLRLWHPEYQARLLANPVQRYIYAISDDEVYMMQKQETVSNGGVFGEGGTAGSVISGCSRRDQNLLPRWSNWLNELRHCLFQLFGLLAGDRTLFSPELSGSYSEIVAVVADAGHLNAMEHRHLIQYLKQFIEYLFLSCPSSLYSSHLAPVVKPVLMHLQYRLPLTWAPVLSVESSGPLLPLTNSTCPQAANFASQGGQAWYASFYARGGLFVGDLDDGSGEVAVEKKRTELTRTFCDVLQSALALKGDWGLVLANIAKEEQANKRSKVSTDNDNTTTSDQRQNADGTPRTKFHCAIEARQLLRINKLCHFLLLEDESVAGPLLLTIVDCLSYPDAYTCRRTTRICHRVLETVAWRHDYEMLLGQQMFTAAVKLLVTEPKWMVGIEWDVMALVRDIYCRLVLGQYLQPGGQGTGMQQPPDSQNSQFFEQSKNVNTPLQGGGILVKSSVVPQQILIQLPGITPQAVLDMNEALKMKVTAKDQKDVIRDLLRIGAQNLHAQEGQSQGGGVFERVATEEAFLNELKQPVVTELPEKLKTMKQARKEAKKNPDHDPDSNSTPNWLFD